MPCYQYDMPATGGDTWIRYAKVRHRHNNGQLSDYTVFIPINVAQYSGCSYSYDSVEPTGVQASGPSGWQSGSATITFSGGTDTGMSLPDSVTTPGNYGSGIHHYEYRIDGGSWTGCPVGQSSVVITKGGTTTVQARVVDGAGNASSQTTSVTVYVDNIAPAVPTVLPSTTAWTNQNVTVTVRDNGDTYSGVNRIEYSLNGNGFVRYTSTLILSNHGRHSIVSRVVDNVGNISGHATATVLIDKVAPVITGVSQVPNAERTQLTMNIAATDANSGIGGYAVTATQATPSVSAFSTAMPTVTQNGQWYVWAIDKAGNISARTDVRVVALDTVPPVVSVATQRNWDATRNWATLSATDDNSGVSRIGWSHTNNGSGISWVLTTADTTFNFMDNGAYYAYAQDLAGNLSFPVRFTIDRIDKHSPIITNVRWELEWTQEKTITVTAHDTESGMGQYAITQTKNRPIIWQNSPVFQSITENGTYYLWAKDNVQRVSADRDADASMDQPEPGPTEVVIDTIDRSAPVIDAIIHSSIDNAPSGQFSFPYFNVVDRPEILAHDVADEGWTASGIKTIYYQFVENGAQPADNWQIYDDAERPAMMDEFFGRIVARAEDHAGNLSAPIDATFLFDTTAPEASHFLVPDSWINDVVEIQITVSDAFSGVRDIELPDGTRVSEKEVSYVVDQNGLYTFVVRDYCGNTLDYVVDVWNIDYLIPKVAHILVSDTWTNQPVTIGVETTDPEPEDGYKPSGIAYIVLPDGTRVEVDAAEFIVKENGEFSFEVFDRAGNSLTYPVQVENIDLIAPTVDFYFSKEASGDVTYPDYGQTEYYNYNVVLVAMGKDVDSGVKTYEYRLDGGAWIQFTTARPPVLTSEQISIVQVRVWDRAGNVSEVKERDIVLDKTPPVPTHSLAPEGWTTGKVTILVSANTDICGPESLVLPDGRVIYSSSSAAYEVTKNGQYTFVFWDRCHNKAEYTVTVSTIYVLENKGENESDPKPGRRSIVPVEPQPDGDPDNDLPSEQAVTGPAAARMTLIDLICTLLTLVCAFSVILRKKRPEKDDMYRSALYAGEVWEAEREPTYWTRRKLPNLLIGIATITLFFLTQPLVLRFRLVDWWTILFVILGTLATWLSIWHGNERKVARDEDEEMED